MCIRDRRRTVQREIEDTLAEKMLYGEVGPGQIVLVDVEGEGVEAKFTFKGSPKSTVPDSVPVSVGAPESEGPDDSDGPVDVPRND